MKIELENRVHLFILLKFINFFTVLLAMINYLGVTQAKAEKVINPAMQELNELMNSLAQGKLESSRIEVFKRTIEQSGFINAEENHGDFPISGLFALTVFTLLGMVFLWRYSQQGKQENLSVNHHGSAIKSNQSMQRKNFFTEALLNELRLWGGLSGQHNHYQWSIEINEPYHRLGHEWYRSSDLKNFIALVSKEAFHENKVLIVVDNSNAQAIFAHLRKKTILIPIELKSDESFVRKKWSIFEDVLASYGKDYQRALDAQKKQKKYLQHAMRLITNRIKSEPLFKQEEDLLNNLKAPLKSAYQDWLLSGKQLSAFKPDTEIYNQQLLMRQALFSLYPHGFNEDVFMLQEATAEQINQRVDAKKIEKDLMGRIAVEQQKIDRLSSNLQKFIEAHYRSVIGLENAMSQFNRQLTKLLLALSADEKNNHI